METYRNLGGDSNVIGYEIGSDFIIVVFKSGRERNYQYTYQKPGKEHVESMKNLAKQGHGLNSYISRIIKSNYYSKW
jgi:hypothetical protein